MRAFATGRVVESLHPDYVQKMGKRLIKIDSHY